TRSSADPPACRHPVLKGLGEVLGAHLLAALEVRDRAGDAEHTVMAAGRQAENVDCPSEQRPAGRIDRDEATQLSTGEVGVRAGLSAGAPHAAGVADPPAHGVARLARRSVHQVLPPEARYVDLEVDPVGDRAADPRAIRVSAGRWADARAAGIAVEAARTWVAGADEERPGREPDGHHPAADVDAALLERLAPGARNAVGGSP